MINWRDIPELYIGRTKLTPDEKNHELRRFYVSFNVALILTFSEIKYKKFGLFFTHINNKDGFEITLYCPEVDFIRNFKKLLSGTYRVEENADIFKKFVEDFTLKISNLPIGNNLAATVVYDEQAGEITLGKHPLHMDFTKTSRLLFFLATIHESNIVHFDAKLIFDDYNLRKVVFYCIDKSEIDISRLKINADNYEEWYYYYPEYDEEVEQYKILYNEQVKQEFPDEHFKQNKEICMPKNEDDFFNIISNIINNFKKDVESIGYKLLLDNNSEKFPSEEKCQILFDYSIKRHAKSQGIDFTREPETRRGTVDFRFSSTVHYITHIELKKSSHPRLIHGLSDQLPTYMESEDVKLGFFIIFDFGDVDLLQQKVKLEEKRIQLEKEKDIKIEIVFIDVRKKPSASKI
jgi:hypothetical protein